MSAVTDPVLLALLRLGDTALVLGQRLGEWVGGAPELEEEMALANFALDYIGQARLYYSLAGEIEGAGRDEDDFAYRRDGMDFHNLLLAEQPNGDFGTTIVRQFLFESFYALQLEQLRGSSEPRLAAIAERTVKEIRYHLRHTRQWLIRLGDGTGESHRRVQRAVDELWMYTGEMFSRDDADDVAIEAGLIGDPAALREPWDRDVGAALAEATLTRPDDGWMAAGGKQGRHSEHLGFLLADLQFLQRAYPGASW